MQLTCSVKSYRFKLINTNGKMGWGSGNGKISRTRHAAHWILSWYIHCQMRNILGCALKQVVKVQMKSPTSALAHEYSKTTDSGSVIELSFRSLIMWSMIYPIIYWHEGHQFKQARIFWLLSLSPFTRVNWPTQVFCVREKLNLCPWWSNVT